MKLKNFCGLSIMINLNEFRNDILAECTPDELINENELVNFLVSHIMYGHQQNNPEYIDKWLPMSDSKLFIEIGKEIAKLNNQKLTNYLRFKYKEYYFI